MCSRLKNCQIIFTPRKVAACTVSDDQRKIVSRLIILLVAMGKINNPLIKKKLTPLEIKFLDEYMIDLNGSEAVMRSHKNYKKASSYCKAADLLSRPHVQEELQKRMDERSKKAEITAEMVLRELAAIAFFDVRKIFDKKNNLKNIADLDDNAGRAISSINIEIDAVGNSTFSTTKKIKLNDKLRALQLVGNHIGMFKESSSTAEDIANALKELARGLPD